MKCKHCGGRISLEVAYCPYCGMPNEHAQQHVKDMQTYHEVYEDTREDVQEAAHKYTGTTVRVIVIAILITVIILLTVLASNGYSLKRSWMRKQAEKNAAQVMEQMDTYLEDEEYISFVSFCDEKSIDTFESDFEGYEPIVRAGRYYAYTYYGIMKIATPPTYAKTEDLVEQLAESLDTFYTSLDMEQYQYYENVDEAKVKEVFASMEEKTELLLQTYCGISEEEAKAMKTMSKAKRAVTLEEAVLSEK